MTTPNQDTNDRQVCVITTMFEVDDDDAAIRIKKDISALIASMPNARVDFRLGSANANQARLPGPVR